MIRFRLLNVPIEVAGSFWIGSLLLGGVGQDVSNAHELMRLAIWVACVFVSIVVHEMGHALVGRHFGSQPHVVLYAMGGLCFLPGRAQDRWRSIAISLAGPAFGLLLYALVWLGAPHLDFPARSHSFTALKYLLYINGFWSLFNLLPVLPLDGGRVLSALLGPSLFVVSRIVGGVVAVGLCAWALNERQWFIAIFMGYLAFSNFKGGSPSLPGP